MRWRQRSRSSEYVPKVEPVEWQSEAFLRRSSACLMASARPASQASAVVAAASCS